jgi:hypothetical protein
MGNWTRTKAAGLLFVAAAAVYSDGLVRATAAEKAAPAAGGSGSGNGGGSRGPAVAAGAGAAAVKGEARQAADKVGGARKGAAAAKSEELADDADVVEAAPVDPFVEAGVTPIVSEEAVTAAPSLTSEHVNVSDAGLVEIHVNDANLGEVLRMLSPSSSGTSWPQGGPRHRHRQPLRRDRQGSPGRDPAGQRLRLPREGQRHLRVHGQGAAGDREAERKMVTETFRVYYTPAANAVNMIKPVLSPRRWCRSRRRPCRASTTPARTSAATRTRPRTRWSSPTTPSAWSRCGGC